MAKLTVLGTGTSLSSFYKPLDFRNEAAYLFQTEKTNILIDCSEGIRQRLNNIGYDYFKLDAIFISHFHPDHFDLVPFIQSFYVRAKLEKRNNLSIYGPRNIKDFFVKSWDMAHVPGHYEDKFIKDFNIDFYEYQVGENISIEDINVSTYKVEHSSMDAYAIRVNFDNKIFAYSGDSGKCDGLLKVSNDADLFLCECGTNIEEEITPDHLNALQAGQIAKKSQAKKLVLTHYKGKDSPETMVEKVKKSGYEGEIQVAQDFQEFQL
jgi:ribonuclease BN (tRNA processing enzyme)